ncbi:MAG: sugar ABC transporter ATP-binding protein [Verrucomicrobia bacterium]|nr:sugar ABC transporter ATP-binding protein [Verrucomicrobiota bacterium]
MSRASNRTNDSSPLLKLDGVGKLFGDFQALKPLHLELAAGEVLGLIGENGAGKSTLIKILSGVHAPDGGTILWHGLATKFASPIDALNAGIATIHQELAYFGRLSVAENMLLGETLPRHRWGGIAWQKVYTEVQRRLENFGLPIQADSEFYQLSAAQRQEVAIARALARDAKLLILDEPTASLTEPEVNRLFGHLQRLREHGVAIIYVSHRLDEIIRLTDRVAVLRDGELVGVDPTRATDVSRLVRTMVGRSLEQVYPRTRITLQWANEKLSNTSTREPVLELDRVTRVGMFRDVSLKLHAGEIVGLAGLVGAGRSELARAIFGLYEIENGTMRLRGKPWRPCSPREALNAGLVYLPEERKRQGFVMEHSVRTSIAIGFTDLLSRWGVVRPRDEASRVRRSIEAFSIRARDPEQAVGTLSGGNQQKALLARWLDRDPGVIILDEPTRGVDVGAKAEIHGLIDRLAGAGKAVLLISSDLPEVLGMSDRLLVMHGGRIVAELMGAAMTQENFIRAASGLDLANQEPGQIGN